MNADEWQQYNKGGDEYNVVSLWQEERAAKKKSP